MDSLHSIEVYNYRQAIKWESADLSLLLTKSTGHQVVRQMGDTQPRARCLDKLLPFSLEFDPGDLVRVELFRGEVPLGFYEPKNLLHPDGPWKSEQLHQSICIFQHPDSSFKQHFRITRRYEKLRPCYVLTVIICWGVPQQNAVPLVQPPLSLLQ